MLGELDADAARVDQLLTDAGMFDALAGHVAAAATGPEALALIQRVASKLRF